MLSISRPLFVLLLAAGPALALEPADPRTCAVGDIGCESGFTAPSPLGTDKDDRRDIERKTPVRPAGAPAALGPAGGTPHGTLLQPGATLYGRSEDYLKSNTVVLRMQADCNLVAYQTTGAVWASNTNRKGSDCHAVMQADGNLVVYSGAGRSLWASATNHHPGGRLVVQDDGNVVIYTGTKPQWATNTVIHR